MLNIEKEESKFGIDSVNLAKILNSDFFRHIQRSSWCFGIYCSYCVRDPLRRHPRCASAKNANSLTRESAVFLLPFSNGHRRTAFRFHYGRRTFFIFKSRRAPRAFYFPPVLFIFTTIPFMFFTHAARKQCHRGHWINFNFLLFAANKNILIRTSVLINN